MIEIILKRPSLSPPLKWLRVSLAPSGGINWNKGIYMVAVKSENIQTIKKVIIN
jgi:hypothetical protein